MHAGGGASRRRPTVLPSVAAGFFVVYRETEQEAHASGVAARGEAALLEQGCDGWGATAEGVKRPLRIAPAAR
jgi:hypothetical protein